MRKPIIVKATISDTIEILGHKLDGLTAIRKAVDCTSTPGSTTMGRGGREVVNDEPYISRCNPAVRIPGLHILEVYKLYPCFDSSDYAYEDRFYRNFFFSESPFTQEQINRIAFMKRNLDLKFIRDEMPEWAFPCAYYIGEGDEIIYAF